MPISNIVALSYVWGRTDMLKTTTSNLELMQKTGTLSPETQELNLQETIRDAIRLTFSLGERYL